MKRNRTSGGRVLSAAVAASLLSGGISLSGALGTTAASASSSTPINIMLEGAISGPVYALPEMVTGAQAAVNHLNKQGGVGGHKVKLITCDDQGNPNEDAACGRKAVADHIVAVVGSLSIYDNNFIPSLAKAHIPYFASTDINPIDHTSPVSFPVNASATDYSAEGKLLAKDGGGCTNAAVLGVDQPGTTQGITFIEKAFKAGGGKTFKTYLYPPATSNFTPLVATAMSRGAKCLSMIGGPQSVVGILEAVKLSGVKIPVNTNLATIVPALYTPVGFPAGEMTVDGTYFVPGPGTTSKALSQYESDMKATGATGAAGAVDTLSENGYQGVLMFAAAAKGVSNITGPNLLANVRNLKNVNTGLTPAFNLSKKGVFPGYPQDRDNNEVYYSWTGSGLMKLGTFTVTPAK
jgi:ABC-type branched-subunit amino acid transport system substrate-binding protein